MYDRGEVFCTIRLVVLYEWMQNPIPHSLSHTLSCEAVPSRNQYAPKAPRIESPHNRYKKGDKQAFFNKKSWVRVLTRRLPEVQFQSAPAWARRRIPAAAPPPARTGRGRRGTSMQSGTQPPPRGATRYSIRSTLLQGKTFEISGKHGHQAEKCSDFAPKVLLVWG